MKQLSFSLSFYLLIYWLKHNKLPFFTCRMALFWLKRNVSMAPN